MNAPRPPATSRRSRRRGALLWLAQLGIYWLVWLGLVGSADKPEMLAALAGAALAATGSHVAWGQHLAHFAAHPRWIAQALRLPVQVVRGTGEVFAVLARQLFVGKNAGSIFLAVPYGATGDDPACAALHALAIAYTSISPDNVVIDIDDAQGYLLYHLLSGCEVPPMARHLGAEP